MKKIILEHHKKCIFCNSKNLIKINERDPINNFYVKAIQTDLNIGLNIIKKIKVHKCLKCKIKINNPWFTQAISNKIFSTIYGQHHRSWQNLINFMNKKILPNHGNLYDFLMKNIKVKNYAEYNSPFMGLFLNQFYNETKMNTKYYQILHTKLINYLSSRQLAGNSRNYKISENKSKLLIKDINKLKKKSKRKIANKTLFINNYSLRWGLNDNHTSVSSKSYSQELFDLQLLQLDYDKKYKFDLFGIFHSLDHTSEPNKLLNFALNNSKYVIVYCHNQKNGVTKQHKFSITEQFLEYLSNKRIYNLNLTNLIKKNFSSSEIYFICSKSKKNIINLKNRLND